MLVIMCLSEELDMSAYGRLDERAVKRVSGPAWERIRPQFDEVNSALLRVGDDVRGELTTIYIKYKSDKSEKDEPFAVLWVKKSTELLLGLSLPEEVESPSFQEPPNKLKYGQLSKYILIPVGSEVPSDIVQLAEAAYAHTMAKS